MTTEKVPAAAGAARAVGLGDPAHTIVRGYRLHVRFNLNRLRALAVI